VPVSVPPHARRSSIGRVGVTALVLLAPLLLPAAATATPPAPPETDVPAARVVAAPPSTARGLTTRRSPDEAPRERSRTPSLQRAQPPTAALTATPVSSIQVSFVDGDRTWTPAARNAFRAAADIWARSVESPVPITVRALATSFADPLVIGSAGPDQYVLNDQGTSDAADDVYEPIALSNARTGSDASPDRPDITASFDPAQPGLSFRADGQAAAGELDFRSVVMHEIGHGLGLVGSARVVDGKALLGLRSGSGGRRTAVAYDQFTYTTSPKPTGSRLLGLADGSPQLLAALTGNQLFWAGPRTLAVDPSTTVRLYAPTSFSPGSSYAHLDEATYPAGSQDALMTPVLDEGQAYSSPGPLALAMLADLGYAVPAQRGSRFVPVPPVRVLDTRKGVGAPPVRLGPAATLDLQITGREGVPARATAVVLNVTAVGPTEATDLRAYPTPVVPSPVPSSSNLNLTRGATRANLVTVAIGDGGRVRLRNTSGQLSVVADLAGYYLPGTGSTFTAVDPRRLLDTRTSGRVAADQVLELPLAGVGPVPADATAVAMTVTALGATTGTDVRVYPGGGEPPLVSNVNLRPGPPVPNLVIVPIGQDGTVRLLSSSGEVHLLADVAGFFSNRPGGALFRPSAPVRVLDTRTGLGTAPGAPTRLGPGRELAVTVGGVASVPRLSTAAVLNVTGVGASEGTDVQVYPTGLATPPGVSNLNLGPGQTAADLVVVRLGGGGRVTMRNSSGSLALVTDVAGWYGP